MAGIGKKAAIGEEEDHQLQLSDLPDEILIRILSLLPTKDAVRTCLLVLRRSGQHHLWKSLTSLHFHQYIIFLESRRFFNYFVDRVMNHRGHSVPLVSFSLKNFVDKEVYEYHIKPWITKAVQCNVEELTLSFNEDEDFTLVEYELPCCIFGCQSLVKLDITFSFGKLNVPTPPHTCLPSLKYLRLEGVEFTDEESAEKLLSSPLLEEVMLESCNWSNIESISVCSPKLQILGIHERVRYSFYSTEIRIIGDNLMSFTYSGDLGHEYEICASSSKQLSKVEIYVNEEMHEDNSPNCYKILKGLSGTRNLALSDYFLEGFQNSSELLDKIPVFQCLTQLDIQVFKKSISIDSLALMKIYERCPHLEYLNFGKLRRTGRRRQLSPIPLCFQTHLKKILVHHYVPGDKKADAAIDVLLNSALVLEELIIYCVKDKVNGIYEGGRKIQEIQDRLNKRPRVSKDCIISVSVTLYRYVFEDGMEKLL